jgi:hypothetical protein
MRSKERRYSAAKVVEECSIAMLSPNMRKSA